ncbi:hypothetical protein IAE16_08665 [Hydrogenobacter sp. T-2]|uniref:hypothetical protein n=1 Tax=Pampinifervens diazotrophicum TaxID=1632018 RepID=UPI002B2613DA|nr:hypothetical protein [Hydrogenobacter sp. T-2]WPM31882.1 hypothetical protein IAE16_08665 [Hydrogenobacter sp. T-2]
MKFYIIAFFLAYFQGSVLITIFHNMLVSPNLLLAYLFLHIFKEDKGWLRKAFITGFFLDLFQDSLGLHLSGHIFFAILFNLMRLRIEIPSRLSLLLAYFLLSLLEKLWLVLLFRIRYYADLSLWLLPLSLALEVLFLYLISGRYLSREP